MRTGLFFGTFNPIHIGHLVIANYIAEFTDLAQIWFVVTPQNPFKKKKTILDNYKRLEMVQMAIEDDNRFRASDIEFGLPVPSYTINTLTYLKEKYPEKEFSLIMGGDNYQTIHKWKNRNEIINNYKIYVYPRPDSIIKPLSGNTIIVNAPLMEISSSMIREAIKQGKNMKYFLNEKVFNYIDTNNLYRK